MGGVEKILPTIKIDKKINLKLAKCFIGEPNTRDWIKKWYGEGKDPEIDFLLGKNV